MKVKELRDLTTEQLNAKIEESKRRNYLTYV